jgi:MFS superfamily sulfate permease-like transporter
MQNLNIIKTGITFGVALASVHFFWGLLILSGFAQALVDFVLWAHMIHLDYVVGPFDLTAFLTLIIFTGFVGLVSGIGFAKVWNWAHRR